MMCCHKCPLHPVLGNAPERCSHPACDQLDLSEHNCKKIPAWRCFLDVYTAKMLYRNDINAIRLAPEVFRKALQNRDRAMLLALFHAAGQKLRIEFWQHLEKFEPRSIWLLNPIFAAAGLQPIESFASMGQRRNEYLNALSASHYAGHKLQAICQTV
ncbi:MAG: hypothetical protein AB1403_01030 [Candidatus Riflebacteria bacterium]